MEKMKPLSSLSTLGTLIWMIGLLLACQRCFVLSEEDKTVPRVLLEYKSPFPTPVPLNNEIQFIEFNTPNPTVAPTTPVPIPALNPSEDTDTPVPTMDFVAPTTPVPIPALNPSEDTDTPVPTMDFVAPTTPVPVIRDQTPEPTGDFFLVLDPLPTPAPIEPIVTSNPTTPITPQPSFGLSTSPSLHPTRGGKHSRTCSPTTNFPTSQPISSRPSVSLGGGGTILVPEEDDITIVTPVDGDESSPQEELPTNEERSFLDSLTFMLYVVISVFVFGGTCFYFFKNYRNALSNFLSPSSAVVAQYTSMNINTATPAPSSSSSSSASSYSSLLGGGRGHGGYREVQFHDDEIDDLDDSILLPSHSSSSIPSSSYRPSSTSTASSSSSSATSSSSSSIRGMELRNLTPKYSGGGRVGSGGGGGGGYVVREGNL